MCCFAGPVENVENTRIYVGMNGPTSRFTAYQMSVQLDGGRGNAMILPVPTIQPESIELVDMSAIPEFFATLDKMFPRQRSRGMSKGLSLDADFDDDLLEVQTVGSYKVSVAPTVDDINRVDRSVFALSPSTSDLLRKHYGQGYSFIVCKLVEDGEIHPLGYIYETYATTILFVPTMHAHGHGDELVAEWDHTVYAQGAVKVLTQPKTHSAGRVSSASAGRGEIDALIRRVPHLLPWCRTGLPFKKFEWSGQQVNLDVRFQAEDAL